MVAPRVSDASVQRSPQRAIPRGALGAAAAVLYVFLWATAFVPSRVLARGAPPLGILAIRFLIAGGILLAIAAAPSVFWESADRLRSLSRNLQAKP